jgi:hypothetical protein
MIRLRRYAATARQVRRRRYAATARQVRRRRYAATARLRRCAASARLALVTGAILLTLGSAPVLACPVCFGAEETSMVDATKFGIIALLAITVAVQGAFLAFFLYLRRRAKRIADIDLENEWSELQGASRT